MIDKFKNILLELNMKELTNGEKRTLQDILKYKIKSCVSDFYVCCGDCPFYKKHNEMLCLHSFYNNPGTVVEDNGTINVNNDNPKFDLNLNYKVDSENSEKVIQD